MATLRPFPTSLSLDFPCQKARMLNTWSPHSQSPLQLGHTHKWVWPLTRVRKCTVSYGKATYRGPSMLMSPFSFFSHLLGCHTSRDRPQPSSNRKWQVRDDGSEQWQGGDTEWPWALLASLSPRTRPGLPAPTFTAEEINSPLVCLSTGITKDLGLPTLLLVDSWSQVTSDLEVRTAFTSTYCCWLRGTLWKYHLDNTCLLSECIDLSTSVPGTMKPEMRANLTNHTGKMWSLGFKLLKLLDVLFKN